MGLFSTKAKTLHSQEFEIEPVELENSKTKVKTHSTDQEAEVKTNETENPENSPEAEEGEEEGTKIYPKEKLSPKALTREQIENEETAHNTNLNALLYHFSNDSKDLYKSENKQLDLLGRMYYDDYDPTDQKELGKVASLPSFASTQSSAQCQNSDSMSGSVSERSSESKIERILFARQVSFDTLSDDHHLSITLKVKHPDFKFRRNNKTFLIGFSNDSESLKAVEWAFLEMVIHGDTIVVLQVLDEKSYNSVNHDLAEKVLEKLKTLNTHRRRISLVYEVVIGNPQKLLRSAITEYKPQMMIVGTRHYGNAPFNNSGSTTNLLSMTHHPNNSSNSQMLPSVSHSSFHKAFFHKTTTSEYFLQYALVPVIIVKPFYEIQETLAKPIDSEEYFKDWLSCVDITHTKERKKKHRFGMRSPQLSRNSSHTNLLELVPIESRGRTDQASFSLGSRDSSRSRSLSRSQSRARSRPDAKVDMRIEQRSDARILSRSESRSESRSRSRSQSQTGHEGDTEEPKTRNRLSKLFGH